MTVFRPSIEIRKLVVNSGGKTAFSADFHSGLNIIHGENSSGKSTIMDFLFYGLGGDISEWREAAARCDEVTIEVLLNDMPVTFQREVGQQRSRPMRIFPGSIEAASSLVSEGWSTYPYKRTKNKESFSQIIFRWLGFPAVPGHESSNITLHQLLRLVYSDQVTPIDNLFRSEHLGFDTPLTRQTVGDILCGAYNNEMYEAQLRLREAEKERDMVRVQLRNIFTALGSLEHSLTKDWVNAERQKLQKDIIDTQQQITEIEERIFNGEVSDGLSQESQIAAYEELVVIQNQVSELREKRDEIQLEIADSDSFIKSLKDKERALHEASTTAEALQRISFLHCPACLAPIEQTQSEHACHLCKTPFDEERSTSRLLLLINEIGVQLKQSNHLQKERIERIEKVEGQLADATAAWETVSRRYKLVNRLPSTELRTKARELHRKAGYLERELENLGEKEALIDRVALLSDRREALDTEISELTSKIEASERAQINQIRRARTRIAENVKNLLKRDLARQSTFEVAEDISFSFEKDQISVNGERFFSASSMVYLRNSFFVAFWKSSLDDESFRFPRLVLMDTIEDKGMEMERSHNFQNVIAEISTESKTRHQFIFATSMISPDLDRPEYVVGRHFTHNQRTLELL